MFSDVNYLSTTAPPAAAEWANLLRPLRGREPEGIWNLLSIVRELFRRRDRNALALLQVRGDARGRRRSVGVVGEGPESGQCEYGVGRKEVAVGQESIVKKVASGVRWR